MSTSQPFRIISKPGIKRDGTLFEGDEYKDGLWCRFSRRGLPTKMGGYSAITSQLPQIVRGMDCYYSGGVIYTHVGSESFLQQAQQNVSGIGGALTDRTPAGFAANVNNLWQFDEFYNTATGQTCIVANAGENLGDITNVVETPIYYGPITTQAQLTATGMPNVAGGLVAIDPYLIGYSINGRVDVSEINEIQTGITYGSAFVSSEKIVKGLPLRNGTGGPAAILWSLCDLVVMTYNPSLLAGIPFNFTTVSGDVSVLSSQGIVEFDGIYYWAEVDHFSMFNGVVLELPNNLNHDWFFANLNFSQRQKVFAVKIQQWGEIWWCYPSGNSTECNAAIIFNVYLNTWYDTSLPDSGRSCGASPRAWNKVYFTDLDETTTGYTFWQHETGTDQVIGGVSRPIRSYIKTTEISPVIGTPAAKDKAYRVDVIEPDFGNVGPLTITVYGRANAQGVQEAYESTTINQPPQTGQDALAVVKENARLLAFQIESNCPGGTFYLGNAIAHIEPTDGRMTQ